MFIVNVELICYYDLIEFCDFFQLYYFKKIELTENFPFVSIKYFMKYFNSVISCLKINKIICIMTKLNKIEIRR